MEPLNKTLHIQILWTDITLRNTKEEFLKWDRHCKGYNKNINKKVAISEFWDNRTKHSQPGNGRITMREKIGINEKKEWKSSIRYQNQSFQIQDTKRITWITNLVVPKKVVKIAKLKFRRTADKAKLES